MSPAPVDPGVAPGQQFGRLTVLSKVQSPYARRGGSALWLCGCSCGKQRELSGNRLVTGNTRSCGCLAHEAQERRLQFKAERFVALGQPSRFPAPPVRGAK